MDRGANGSQVPWAGLFCGRENELAQLTAAFERVAAGQGPQVAVVLGESGLGKTRLVQEFFARLSRSVDPDGEGGYWPDHLIRDNNNLKINPDPADCNPTRVAEMKFLWWGLRLLDTAAANSGTGGLQQAVPDLQPHLEPFARSRLLASRMRDAATGAAVDVAIEIGNLFTFGLLGLGKLGLDHAREWRQIMNERMASATHDLAASGADRRKSLVDTVLEDLGALFESSERKGAVLPMVILLDDAQWLAADAATCEFVERLLERATQADWPLLLLATHWEKEWHEDLQGRRSASFASMAVAHVAEDWKPIKLGRESELGALVRVAFPGLSPGQVELLLEKADGNPLVLDEIMRELLVSRGHFVRRNPSCELTQSGERAIRETSVSLHTRIANRLARAPDHVQVAVALSGVQGLRFLSRLTAKAAAVIGGEDYRTALDEAESPHAMVSRLEKGLAEFSQRVFYEVARERSPHIVDPSEAREAIRSVLRELAGPEAFFPSLSSDERKIAWELGARLMHDPDEPEFDWDDRALAAWCNGQLALQETKEWDPGIHNLFGDLSLYPEAPQTPIDKFLFAYNDSQIDVVGASHSGQRLINLLLFSRGGWAAAEEPVESHLRFVRHDFDIEPTEDHRRDLAGALTDKTAMLMQVRKQIPELYHEASFPELRAMVDEALDLAGDRQDPFWLDQMAYWGPLRATILYFEENAAAIEWQKRALEACERLIANPEYPSRTRYAAEAMRARLGHILLGLRKPDEAQAVLQAAYDYFATLDPGLRTDIVRGDLIEATYAKGDTRLGNQMASAMLDDLLERCTTYCGRFGTAEFHGSPCNLPMHLATLAANVWHHAGGEAAIPYYRKLKEAVSDPYELDPPAHDFGLEAANDAIAKIEARLARKTDREDQDE